ncbi:MAG: dienelactone hydrolase family protein [Burkholderiales bacterium]
MEQAITYEIDGRKCEGMLVAGEKLAKNRPVILLQCDWKGVCPETIAQARLVAGDKYFVFMADMWGAGFGAKAKSFEDLMKVSRALRADYPFTVANNRKAMDILLDEGRKHGADTSKVGLVGYCAGGGFALEYARTGPKVNATVVFHVTNPNPLDASRPSNIQGKVLVLHGSVDPVTPLSSIRALEAELDATKVPWQTVIWSGACHSFTDVAANDPGRGMYDAVLDRRSNVLAQEFLAETL